VKAVPLINESVVQQGIGVVNGTINTPAQAISALPLDLWTIVLCLVWMIVWSKWKGLMANVALLLGIALVLIMRGYIGV